MLLRREDDHTQQQVESAPRSMQTRQEHNAALRLIVVTIERLTNRWRFPVTTAVFLLEQA